VLQEITKKSITGLARLLDCGHDKPSNCYYIVTELLGTDILKLLSRCEDRKFRRETAIRVGLQMFNRIQDLHKVGGFVHRDIKLNNFVCTAHDNFTHPDTGQRLAQRQATSRNINRKKSVKS